MEQTLIEDLVIESIRIYGLDVWYVRRSKGSKDELLNENDLPIYDQAHMLEMYIKNVDGFEGEGDFLSKFGLQIRDSITFSVAFRVYEQEVGRYTGDLRPREGDIIYFPLNGKLFEIMHVEHEAIFYQLGALQMYDLRCELFEYSNERFQTGNQEIDSIAASYETESAETLAELEEYDPLADNATIENFGDNIVDFSETNPFGEDDF